ncbi:hypothetical protein E2C01_069685 [Portunus trituberculatus]|uniref:Uncharacterized protein n=1 Tax=Portunus trituberculatus TaxID=210409 RepID=A0A5B7I087_PORTR|nr:hypothetical protein [Portunus trituberculatus]
MCHISTGGVPVVSTPYRPFLTSNRLHSKARLRFDSDTMGVKEERAASEQRRWMPEVKFASKR